MKNMKKNPPKMGRERERERERERSPYVCRKTMYKTGKRIVNL